MKNKQSKLKTDLWLLLWLIIIFAVYSLILRQDSNWDLRNYHFYNAFAWLYHRRTIDVAPNGMHFYFPATLDVVLYILQTKLPMLLYTMLNGSLSAFSAFACYKLLDLLLKESSPRCRKLLLFTGTFIAITGFSGLTQVSTSFGSNITSIFIIWGIYGLIYYTVTNKLFMLILSGILFGIPPALKLTSVVYSVAAIIVFVLFNCRQKKSICLLIISTVVAFLITHFPWMLQMYHEHHNPFYPILSQWLNPDNVFIIGRDTRFLPKTISQWLFYPFYFLKWSRHTAEMSLRDPRLSILYLTVLATIIGSFFKKTPKTTLMIALIALGSYILWLVIFSIQRYAVASELLSGILLALTLDQFINYHRAKTITTVMLLIITIALTRFNLHCWGRSNFHQRFYQVDMHYHPKHSLIILNKRGISYLIPSFDKTNRFIGGTGNLVSYIPPGDLKKRSQLIHQFIHSQKPIYMMDFTLAKLKKSSLLKQFKLTVDSSHCYSIKTPVHVDNCYICRLQSISPNKSPPNNQHK